MGNTCQTCFLQCVATESHSTFSEIPFLSLGNNPQTLECDRYITANTKRHICCKDSVITYFHSVALRDSFISIDEQRIFDSSSLLLDLGILAADACFCTGVCTKIPRNQINGIAIHTTICIAFM